MSEQIFISYRREGGNVTAKLICEALKNRGYTVFYDYDSLQGGYFDSRILNAIEECNDFVLVLPPNSLDRCVNEDDWVRLEIRHALKYHKNIIPVMLSGFSFPANLPRDISEISRYNGIEFVMSYFDRAVIPEIIDRLTSVANFSQQSASTQRTAPQNINVSFGHTTDSSASQGTPKPLSIKQRNVQSASQGLEFTPNMNGYTVTRGTCQDTCIVIPRFYNGKPVTKIGDKAFYENSSLTSITLPDGIVSIGNSAFEQCFHLESINLPNSITRIDMQAFDSCINLKSINIPNGVVHIGQSAFRCCFKIKSAITIPDGVTSIERNVFDGCKSIKSVTLPSSITSIKMGAFGSIKLKTIQFNGTIEQWERIRLEKYWSDYQLKVVKCSNGKYII